MSEIRVDKLKDEAGTGAVELTTGATIPSGKTISGAGGINISGDITTSGTLTYEDVTSVDSIGIVTAQGGLKVGTSGAGATITSSGDAVFAGLTTTRFGGVSVTVSFASTTNITTGKEVILELDCSKGSVFTHNLATGGPVGIVSIRNFRVNTNTFTTATVIFTQGSSTPTGGIGNTFVTSLSGYPGGIGTEVTLAPLGVAEGSGITTNARVGSATTVVLSATADDIDIVTFGVHYNGGGTGTAGNYTTIVTKSGDIRFGSIGF